ncbi:hypothetical protein D3C85_1817670 [compost metagenome]
MFADMDIDLTKIWYIHDLDHATVQLWKFLAVACIHRTVSIQTKPVFTRRNCGD